MRTAPNNRFLRWVILGMAGAGFAASIAWAETSTPADPVAEYREMFGDDNPAELWTMRGENLWSEARGPGNVALAKTCDLGMGVGVVKGAYAHLPRYFEDTGKVQDLETRLVTCMTTEQGFKREDILKHKYGEGDDKSDLEALSAYIVDASKGVPIDLPMDHPQEKHAYEVGKAIFYYRAGPHDFGCSTCHGQPDKRIRLQTLPDLAMAKGAREAYTTWPAYRVSQGEVRTVEWRLHSCLRQQRMPELKYGSEAAIALTMFLAKNAEGGKMDAPGLKR